MDKISINIIVKGKKYELSMKEALSLYEDLDSLLGKKINTWSIKPVYSSFTKNDPPLEYAKWYNNVKENSNV